MCDSEKDPFYDPLAELAELYEIADIIEGIGGLVTIFGVANDLDGNAYVNAVYALRAMLWDASRKIKCIHKQLRDEESKRVIKEMCRE